MLIAGTADYITKSKITCMIDVMPPAIIDSLFPKSPKVLNSHYRLDVLPAAFHGHKNVIGKTHELFKNMRISLRNQKF